MLKGFEKIAYDMPDRETSPESTLDPHIQVKIEMLKQKLEATLDETNGTDILLQYAELESDPYKKRVMTFVARRVDKYEDFRTKQGAKGARMKHTAFLEKIDEVLTVAENLGLKVLEPLKIAEDKSGHHFMVIKPIKDPSNKPAKEVPEDFESRKQVSDTIRKCIEYIPSSCYELLFHLHINSKNMHLLTYEELNKCTGLAITTIKDKLKLLEQYLPKLKLQLFKERSATNQKKYFGICMLDGGAHLGFAFRKAEAQRDEEKQKQKKKALRKRKIRTQEGKSRPSTSSLISRFKKPGIETYDLEPISWASDKSEDN